jgi:hypothetical protein
VRAVDADAAVQDERVDPNRERFGLETVASTSPLAPG